MTRDLSAKTIHLQGHQGAELEAYLASPKGSDQCGGVVVVHHMPGYDEGTREIVRRFAAHGYVAVCPNLYSREGIGRDAKDAAAAVREKGGVADEQVVGDVAACLEHLRGHERSNHKEAVIGYCSGGRHALLAACSLPFEAAIDCYGGFVVDAPPPDMALGRSPVVGRVRDLSGPLLGLFGADDEHPSPRETALLEQALEAAGKEHEFHTLEGAGHAFFAVDRPFYRPEAATEGWEIIWEFLGRTIA